MEELMEFIVTLDGETIGEVMILIGKNKKIHAKSLKEVLKDYLTDDQIKSIDKIVDKKGFVDFNSIQFLKMKMKFNISKLLLEIEAPPEIKKTRSLGQKMSMHQDRPNVKPATFSGFINTRISQTNTNASKQQADVSRTLLLSPALNFNGIVLESECSYSKQSKNFNGEFNRNYSSIVYDIPDKNMTLSGGDIFSHSVEYQSIPKAFGLGFNKTPQATSIDNFNNSIQITLLRTSRIEIYVNDTLIKTKNNIAPGPYTLDDIPYQHGTNNVKIKIIDDTGREQILDSNVFLDSSFLQKNQYSCGGTVGAPEVNQENMRYDKKNIVMSGFTKYGLMNATEIALGIQKNKIGGSYSTGIRNKNKLGFMDLKAATSEYKETYDSVKGKVLYFSYSSHAINIFKNISTNFGVSLESADTFFYPYLGSMQPLSLYDTNSIINKKENIKGKNSNIRYFLFFNNVLNTSWSANYSIRNRPEASREKAYSVNAYKIININGSIFKHGFLNTSFERSIIDQKVNRSMSISVSFSLNDFTSISAGYYNAETKSSIYSISKSSNGEGLGYSASFNPNNESKTYNARVNYDHSRFQSNVNHNRISSLNNSNSTQAGLETTLFFADGAFSIARNNINDGGFVIVRPKKSLENTKVKFMNNASESGLLGGAVITTARNQINSSKLDIRNIPDGLEVKQDSIINEGLYKRGAVVDIICEGSHTAEGILHDGENKPIALVSGYAIHSEDHNAKPVQFFTNEEGNFLISELKPGKYKVNVNIENFDGFEIDVKETEKDIIDLGIIKCNKVSKNDNIRS